MDWRNVLTATKEQIRQGRMMIEMGESMLSRIRAEFKAKGWENEKK